MSSYCQKVLSTSLAFDFALRHTVCACVHVDVQIAALEKELKNQRTELDSRVFYLQSVETVYRTEAQESGIAKLGVNIKNAYDSPQTNSRLQDIHVAYKAVQSKRNEVKELGRNIRPLRKHDCGLESQMTRLNLQQQQYAAQVRDAYPHKHCGEQI